VKLEKQYKDFLHSPEFIKENSISQLVNEVKEITGHQIEATPWENYLDNIIDCTMSHYCHSMPDVPKAFFQNGLFDEMNRLETLSRSFPFDYYSSNPSEFKEFSSLYFGHYFKVLHDRMKSKIEEHSPLEQTETSSLQEPIKTKDLYIQVTSDSKITPQLKMLGFHRESQYRPPWGSALVYELFKNTQKDQYAVRITFNGQICKLCDGKDFCSWEEFSQKISYYFPEHSKCKNFYENYEFS